MSDRTYAVMLRECAGFLGDPPLRHSAIAAYYARVLPTLADILEGLPNATQASHRDRQVSRLLASIEDL